MAFTKIVSPGIDTTGSYTVQELNTVGVATAGTVQVGSATTIHTTGIDLGSGNITSHNINSTGSITATSFIGPVTGDITGNITGDITATSGTFSGNVSIGGTLTYEDVTNIDSVGIITANTGIHIDDSISHLGDTDTAIRFPAADTFTVETGGSERLRITSSGSVGIGTDAPATHLDVRRSTAGTIARFYDNGNNGGSLYNSGPIVGLSRISDGSVSLNGPLFQVGIDKNSSDIFNIDETLFCVSNTGVGIGTVNPNEELHIHASGTSYVRFTDESSGIGVTHGSIFGLDHPHLYAWNYEAGDFVVATNATEKLRINSDGTIRLKGDGSAPNKARFEINEKWNNNATDFGIDFKRTYDVGGDDQDAGFIHVKRNGGSSQSGMSFGIGDKDAVSEKLIITSNGDVGIGTAIPVTSVNYSSFSLVNGIGAQIELKRTSNNTRHYIYTDTNDNLNIAANYSGTGTGDLVLKVGGNNERLRINSSGYMTTAPSGMMIRSGFYDTGVGADAKTEASTSWITMNINGTGQILHNLTKFSTDGLAYNKVSDSSHLNITVNFPFYYDDSDGGGGGFGVRAFFSTDDGTTYHSLSGLVNGPCDGWGAGGYGGPAAGVFTYTWNTRMNSTQASTILAKTGNVRFYFQCRIWAGTSTLFMNNYNTTYNKKGTIIVQEIAE